MHDPGEAAMANRPRATGQRSAPARPIGYRRRGIVHGQVHGGIPGGWSGCASRGGRAAALCTRRPTTRRTMQQRGRWRSKAARRPIRKTGTQDQARADPTEQGVRQAEHEHLVHAQHRRALKAWLILRNGVQCDADHRCLLLCLTDGRAGPRDLLANGDRSGDGSGQREHWPHNLFLLAPLLWRE
eukprot:766212-Hanusia_phi.AAC.6